MLIMTTLLQTITGKEVDDYVVLTVCDHAGGIPMDIIDHIFESDFTTKAEGKGTGIGLYLTKQIVDKIGVKISACNKEHGVCFEIILKAAAQ